MKDPITVDQQVYEFNNAELELIGLLIKPSTGKFLVFKTDSMFVKFFDATAKLERLKLVRTYLLHTKIGTRWHVKFTKLGHLTFNNLNP